MFENTRRSLSLAGIAALGAVLLPAGAAAQTQTKGVKNKLVLQVSDNDPAKWALTFNNVSNVQADLGEDDVEMEVVAYGPGIAMLKAGSPMAQRITAALKTGVKVVACENTMKTQKLSYADMLPDIGYVQAGVVELMQKQQQGYDYIKP